MRFRLVRVGIRLYPAGRRPQPDDLLTMNMTRNLSSVALAIAGVCIFSSCTALTPALAENANPLPCVKAPETWDISSIEKGKASWYSIRTNRGTATASGQKLCEKSSTAAHKTLPMGSVVRVVNLANGKSEIVTINDRGPFIKGRIIDVTIGVAERLGFASRGVVPVKVEVLQKPDVPAAG